ncbi:stage II sporulation protein R [Sporosarcina trichiuri]|uniref:stage II sporulation protein R n=1 Tax=Sporosarcina trichiuri TaxID=3056445 RepID=UPI0025B4E14A|nr:stage II sporulation protein R [Sporosarcina sp. 0.2-SM1T-5]WJY26518.1 stage II sporulation protein R [Sporosarcina sp. 0.2-SM1T-5]
MLQDYPQFTQTETIGNDTRHTWKRRLIVFAEFLLIMVMLQAVLSLFQTHENEEPVRYRILAHSDSASDQAVKVRIQQEIEPMITAVLANTSTQPEIDAALKGIEADMLAAAETIAPDMPVALERSQALFPAKRAGLWITPQDTYDAYILTIGSGRGSNWWCSIFPKVCYEEEEEEEPVKFFVWEWITSLFKA